MCWCILFRVSVRSISRHLYPCALCSVSADSNGRRVYHCMSCGLNTLPSQSCKLLCMPRVPWFRICSFAAVAHRPCLVAAGTPPRFSASKALQGATRDPPSLPGNGWCASPFLCFKSSARPLFNSMLPGSPVVRPQVVTLVGAVTT